jgi:hypothetical protein
MITLSFVLCRVHLVVYESFSLKEVFPPLLLVYLLLRLTIALLDLRLPALFEFLDEFHNLQSYRCQ